MYPDEPISPSIEQQRKYQDENSWLKRFQDTLNSPPPPQWRPPIIQSPVNVFYSNDDTGIVIDSAAGRWVIRNPLRNPPNLKQPIPRSINDQLRLLDLENCGQIFFKGTYTAKAIYEDWNNGVVTVVKETVTLDDVIRVRQRCLNVDDSFSFLESGGQQDNGQFHDLGNNITYRSFTYVPGWISDNCELEKNFPWYEWNALRIEVLQRRDSEALNLIMNQLENTPLNFEVYEIQFNNSEFCPLTPGIQPPPPPPEKEKCECMCCDECKNNDQLLKLILKKIGSADLPATVPNWLTKTNSGTKTIDNLAQFISYSVKQMDAITGKYPFEIQIQDADLTQEGDQTKKIEVPNIAEALAEIMGLLLVLQSESNANLIATVNAMIEAGSAKQAAIIAGDYASANSVFLGYKGKHVEKTVPFTFKPGEQQLDKMLKTSEVKVKSFDNDDKNDLNDVLMPLLEMAAMYRAQNFRNVGASDPLGKLSAILRGTADISTILENVSKLQALSTDPEAPPPEPRKTDWETFVDQAETGFIAQPGITDNLNPYGRPLEQRPRIREIGADTSENP